MKYEITPTDSLVVIIMTVNISHIRIQKSITSFDEGHVIKISCNDNALTLQECTHLCHNVEYVSLGG